MKRQNVLLNLVFISFHIINFSTMYLLFSSEETNKKSMMISATFSQGMNAFTTRITLLKSSMHPCILQPHRRSKKWWHFWATFLYFSWGYHHEKKCTNFEDTLIQPLAHLFRKKKINGLGIIKKRKACSMIMATIPWTSDQSKKGRCLYIWLVSF